MTAAINKMCNALQQADESFDKCHWKFYPNNHNDIPVQGNGYDCGVFVSLYARCLVSKGSMIKQFDIPDFRKNMILELHEKKLNLIPTEPTKPNEYYAVGYINNYYFGRVLEAKSNDFISSSFCTVLVVTNMIGPEEMTLIKYMFLVFFMGQCIWREIGLLLLLQSSRKLKKYFWQLKSKNVLKFLPRNN